MTGPRLVPLVDVGGRPGARWIADLSEDSAFVRLQFTEVVDSPVAMAAFVVAEGARFAEEAPVSALS